MISHHRQAFYESSAEAVELESDRLSALIGCTFDRAWLAIDSDGEWFNDEPALLQFADGRQLEIGVYKVGLLALTWNSVDVELPANWLGCWNQKLSWEVATCAPWMRFSGQQVRQIQLIDHDSELGSGVFGLQLKFSSGGHLVVFNALDELGVNTTAIVGPDYQLHTVGD